MPNLMRAVRRVLAVPATDWLGVLLCLASIWIVGCVLFTDQPEWMILLACSAGLGGQRLLFPGDDDG